MLTFEEYCEEPYFIAKLDEIIRSSMQAFAAISQRVDEDRNEFQTFAEKREFPLAKADVAVDLLDAQAILMFEVLKRHYSFEWIQETISI